MALMFLDPTDDFINAHLELVIEGERRGKRPQGCPLFNGVISRRTLLGGRLRGLGRVRGPPTRSAPGEDESWSSKKSLSGGD